MRVDGGIDCGGDGEGVQDPATPGGERSEPRGRRDGSRCGVQRLGDEPKERLAGPLDFLGGLQVGGGMCYGVELLEGDARLQEAIGSGQRSELLVRGHDQFLGVLPAAAPALRLDLDGEQAGPVMVEEGGEEVAQEGVGRCVGST